MITDGAITFCGEIWLYRAEKAAWHFITVPVDVAARIRILSSDRKRGWGSVHIDVTIGATRWKTSVFPDSKAGTYILPIKALVRNNEGIGEGDAVAVSLRVVGV